MDSRIGAAITSLEVPAVSDFEDANPMDIIKTGDIVIINGTTGLVEIRKQR